VVAYEFHLVIDHGGSLMPRINAEELKARRQEFLDEAGRSFDNMLGTDGRNGLVTFEEREDRACELGDALTCRLLEEHLAADEAADPGGEASCPCCDKVVRCPSPEKEELQQRQIRTKRGVVEYERAARLCKTCRRVFFPRGRSFKAEQRGL
jgi:hypothetical protein